jgi:hypothetical protein
MSRPSRIWHVVDYITITVGILLAFGGTAVFAFNPEVTEVDPRDMEVAARLAERSSNGWLVVTALAGTGIIAAAGLRRPRTSEVAARSAGGQLVAAVATGVVTAVASWVGAMWLFAPPDRCVYASCWPADAQAIAIATPGLLTAVSLGAAALLVRKVSWSVRALAPAGVWFAAVLLLHVVWAPWLLPVFQASPP